jgi:hypothetical protein
MLKSKIDIKRSSLCHNYASKFAFIVLKRLCNYQKHIPKVQSFLRTLIDKGRKGLFLESEKAL